MPAIARLANSDAGAGTRMRLIEAAVECFVERGFDAVSLSEITKAADANIAAVNYHFGSKENLIRESFHLVAEPFNEARLQALEQYEAAIGPKGLTPEGVVRAYLSSTIELTKQATNITRYYNRFAFLLYAVRHPSVSEILADETDRIAERFVDALSRALPGFPRKDIIWRYQLLAGATAHILLDSERLHRVRRLSGDECDTDDPAELIEQTVRFAMGGICAAPLKKRPRRRGSTDR
jgi:AcrR family transcriptional regulator